MRFPRQKSPMPDRTVRRVFGWLCGLLAFSLLFPVRFEAVKLLLVASALGLWLGTLFLLRSNRFSVVAVILLPVCLIGLLCLPGRPVQTARLRAEYVRSLREYRGTVYIWGGGNRLGIDCSGLVRRGLADADVRLGLATGNMGIVRQGIGVWWHNCSARALGEGYRDETYLLQNTSGLNTLAADALLPGDFAVTEDGTHTLVYLGNRTWIEAEPRAGRVIEKTLPDSDIYFNEPMRLMRWRQFDHG